jgi:ABC-2 type transport system ATP-binding protein
MSAGRDGAADAVLIEDLTVAFGKLRALDAISFSVPVGSITGLIGRNGAGKTTSIRCLAGILQPTTVSRLAVMGGSPLTERREVLAATGFLLSEPALFRYLTPLETLLFLARAYRLDRAESESRSAELLSFFDLEAAQDRAVDEFSTGMLKRLSLAAALIHAPRLLILDEPFESLDPLMVRSLKKLLKGYAEGGGTVLLSSHLIDAVEEICDRVIILEQGRVVTAGPTDEVRSGISSALPAATLEDLYASLIPASEAVSLAWLTAPRGAGVDTAEMSP